MNWYHKKRNEANRMCATKKKELINKTIRQIEENYKRNDQEGFQRDKTPQTAEYRTPTYM